MSIRPHGMSGSWFGWCLYDWANSAFATVILAAVLPVYFVHLVPEAGAEVFWSSNPIQASVLWSYGVSLSMLLVAATAPYLGAIGDRRGRHNALLALFCGLGAACTMALFFARDSDYALALGLFICANFAFAAANIFYNAFLPALAREEGDMDRLSAFGFALGYIGGGAPDLLPGVVRPGRARRGHQGRLCVHGSMVVWLCPSCPVAARKGPAQAAQVSHACRFERICGYPVRDQGLS